MFADVRLTIGRWHALLLYFDFSILIKECDDYQKSPAFCFASVKNSMLIKNHIQISICLFVLQHLLLQMRYAYAFYVQETDQRVCVKPYRTAGWLVSTVFFT